MNRALPALLVVCFLVSVVLSSSAGAQVYSSATYVTRAPYQPSFQTYYGVQANTYWPILNDAEQCKNREDFILQTAPGGCEPAVVRSDLLAEQNVPVFCQINALKVNPLLDVKEIRSIGFDKDYPKGVVAVGFHPARAALRTRDRLLGDPLINNIGYAVVVLQKQARESELPSSVTVNLSGRLEYDAGNALGIGRSDFVLEEQGDQIWADRSQRQSFWNGRYALRLLHADERGADVAIYSGDRQIATTHVEKGRRSREIFVPESYCRAALYVDYTEYAAAQTRARLAIASANGTDVIDVYEGSRILDGRCSVSRIQTDNTTLGSGNVTLRCPGETIILQLKPRSAVSFDVFVDAEGKKSLPVREGGEYLVELQGVRYNLTANDVLYQWKSGQWEKAATSAYVKRLRDAMQTYRALEQSGRVSPEDVVFDASWAETNGVEGNFSEAVKAFEDIVKKYPAEKRSIVGTTYGQESLQRAIALTSLLGKEQQRLRFLQLYIDTYPGAPESDAYQQELARSERLDFSQAAAALEVNQHFRTIRLVELREPREQSTATFAFGQSIVVLRAGESRTIRASGDAKAQSFTLQRIEADYVTLSTTCPRESQRDFRPTMRVGESVIACGQPVVLQRLDVQKSARISLIPQAWGSETKTNLTIRIGIEKRAIQLAPNVTLTRISELNASIRKWEQISTSLGNVVSGMKAACFATAGALTVKNFVTGLSGSGFARQQVMRGERGWTARCQAEVSAGREKSLDACFSKHAADINRDVEIADAQIQNVNAAIRKVEADVPKSSGILSSSLDPSQAVPKYREYLLGKHGPDKIQIKDSKGVRDVEVRELLGNPKGYEDGEYSYESLRELHQNLLLQQSSSVSNGTKQNAEQRLQTLGSTISVNHALTEKYKAEQSMRSQGFPAPFTATRGNQNDRYVEIVPTTAIGARAPLLNAEGVTHAASIVVPPSKDSKTGVAYSGGTYLLGLQDAGEGAYTIKGVLKKEGEGASATYLPHDGATTDEINAPAFASTYGLGTLYSQQQLSYFNKYENPEVKFYDREPYKGMPAIVPLDLQRGWYVATKQTLPVFGGTGAFDASGRATSFWLCNVGVNKREQFLEGLGDDICEMVNLQTGQPLNKFPGLSDTEARALVVRGRDALEQTARQHGNSRVTLTGTGDVRVGKPAVSVPSVQCQDFMSPSECSLIFNLCDPVICPRTRCDFGGKYPVADVVQSGIIGSTLLCLPNFPEVKVPVCLTGIHAGIDSYVSILKAHRDCLQESVKSGKLVGVCDQLYSIYTCEFFWRQLAPLAKVLVPRLLESAYGQGVRGGGEYLTVMGAWSQMQQSVQYFTQVYGVNSFKAFQARSVEEAGGEFCKSFISMRAPTSLKTVLAPDSPPQFHAYFSAMKFSTATVPATAQYKVYYHLYAGKDQGAYYRVYLKSPPQLSYYAAAPIVQVASGFVKKGDYKDETRDFTAPEGYQELCVNVNGEETCGFKQVSTSFAVNYVRDAIVADQIKESTITSEKECISGSTSATALLNPNLQQAGQEVVAPELYRRGVIRICATRNPGEGTEPTRFVPVGRCDDEKVQCWLDKRSVDTAITDNNLGIRNATLQELERIQRANLEKGGVFFGENVSNAELQALEGLTAYVESGFKARSDSAISATEITQIQAILSRARTVRNSLYLNHHQAQLLYVEGKVYAAVAEQLSKQKRLQSQRGGVSVGSTTMSLPSTPAAPSALEVPSDLPVGGMKFELDYNPRVRVPGFDRAVTVHYDHIRLAWIVDEKTWAAGDEAASLAASLQRADFAAGIGALLRAARETRGEIRTDKTKYREGAAGFEFLMSEGKEQQSFAYRDGQWQRFEGGKWAATGVPPSKVFAELWNNLQGLDEQSGAVVLFAYNSPEVYERMKAAPRVLSEDSSEITEPSVPAFYTVKEGKTPSGDTTLVVHAGVQPLGIYILPGKYVFVQQAEHEEVSRVGATDDQLNFVINEEQVRASGAPITVQQHVLALQGRRYRHLIDEGSIVVSAPIPTPDAAGFKGTISETQAETPATLEASAASTTSPSTQPQQPSSKPTAGQLQQNPGEG